MASGKKKSSAVINWDNFKLKYRIMKEDESMGRYLRRLASPILVVALLLIAGDAAIRHHLLLMDVHEADPNCEQA